MKLSRIFTTNPEVKPLWRFAANLNTVQEMRQSNQLRSHGKNVFEVLNAAVNSLNNIESLDQLLVDLGKRHSTYGVTVNHFPVSAHSLFNKCCIKTTN